MHISAKASGKLFFEHYWRPGFLSILDIGSLDVNGSLRQFAPLDARYVGIDLVAGKGVDQVLTDPYSYPFPDDTFDLIVSTSCFEHDALFWLTFLEAMRVLSPHGFFYINAPARADYHHPPDRWRFYPDAGTALKTWADRNKAAANLVESCILTLVNVDGRTVRNPHMDCVMVFGKHEKAAPSVYLSDVAVGAEWVRKGASKMSKPSRRFV